MEEHAIGVAGGPVSRRRRIVRAVLALVLAVGFFLLSNRSEEMFELESLARDFAARTRSVPDLDAITIVTITNDDYANLFRSRSPLDPDALGRIIRAAAAGRPRVIAVDIETSDTSFARLRPVVDSLRRAGTALVFARDAIPCAEEAAGGARDRAAHVPCSADADDPQFIPLGVLGSGAIARSDDSVPTGLPTMELDPKSTVRYYRQVVAVAGGDDMPAFATAVRRAYEGPANRTRADSSRRLITFHGGATGTWRITAAELLRLCTLPDSRRRMLEGRIVMIGGSFRAARDVHHTPVGLLSGIDIQAQTLETELRGGGQDVPSTLALGVTQFVATGLIVLLMFHFAPARAAAALVVAVPLLSMIGSRLVTRSWVDGVMYFLPLFLLLVLHQLYEKANTYRELLLKELRDQRRKGLSEEESVRELLDGVDARLTTGASLAGRAASALGRRIGGRTPATRGEANEAPASASDADGAKSGGDRGAG
jgi:Predicted transmembrane sensor domain